MTGADVPGLIWRADRDDFVTDYFGQGELRFVPNGDVLELDFFGGMQMTFRAEYNGLISTFAYKLILRRD